MTARDLLDRPDLAPAARRQVAAQRRLDQDLGLAIAAEALIIFAALIVWAVVA